MYSKDEIELLQKILPEVSNRIRPVLDRVFGHSVMIEKAMYTLEGRLDQKDAIHAGWRISQRCGHCLWIHIHHRLDVHIVEYDLPTYDYMHEGMYQGRQCLTIWSGDLPPEEGSTDKIDLFFLEKVLRYRGSLMHSGRTVLY